VRSLALRVRVVDRTACIGGVADILHATALSSLCVRQSGVYFSDIAVIVELTLSVCVE